MPLTILGAGFHRTGTLSLHVALEILGFRSHHSYTACFPPGTVVPGLGEFGQTYPHNQELLTAAAAGKHIDFGAFEGYDALVDMGFAFEDAWAQLPHAKVILTVRDDMDSWWKSYANGIAPINTWRLQRDAWKAVPDHPITAFDHGGNSVGRLFKLDKGGKMNKARAIQAHLNHIQRVKSAVPPSQLLVFRPQEGWEPLCRFLGKPVPDVPFPHANEAGTIAELGMQVLMQYPPWLGMTPEEMFEEYAWKIGVDREPDDA
ncbi:P-loop containing nucleoside triphosphate hydrolase protein [Hyaloraphidium curvatum]|nr:P-loop containing nucleoside triphosphate hydrolase protein [Hyaloraphidium curvatum]